MVFEVPAAKRSIDQNLFKFKMPAPRDTVLDEERWQAEDPDGYTAWIALRDEAEQLAAEAQRRFAQPAPRVTYKLPKLQFIKPALFERLNGSKKIEIIRALTDEYIPGLFDAFEDPDQLLALYNAWAEESGISVGESSGSTSSSERTVEPYDETSSPSADPSTT